VYTFLLIVHVLISILLMLAILMQASKGGGLSGTFGGGGGSSSLFGGRGAATFLSKVTTGLAVAFMVISMIIGLISAPRGEATSIIRQEANRRTSSAADLPIPQGSAEQGSENLPGN